MFLDKGSLLALAHDELPSCLLSGIAELQMGPTAEIAKIEELAYAKRRD